jgi:G8 domain
MGIISRLLRQAAQATSQQPRRRLARNIFRPRLEQLEIRLAPHANTVLDAEHLAVFGAQDAVTGVVTGGLVPDAAATYRSKSSGVWSSPDTWQYLGSVANAPAVPGVGDNVVISQGTTVTLDGVTAAVRTVRDDGTLSFDATKDTTLKADTIIVEPTGTYQMGTATQPIEAAHKAQVIFVSQMSAADRLVWDPLQFSLGFVSHGDVSIYGSHVDSFVAVPTALPANTQTFDLGSVPAGWKAGDRLIITGDTAANDQGQNQDEEPALQALNGSMATLSAPLKYNHSAGSVYVSDVSRNTVFASDPAAFQVDTSGHYVGTVADRGHVMFMHNDDVHVDAAGFYGLGRTDKRTLIDDPVLVDDTDHPGQKTTDVLLKDPNPTLPPDIAAKYGAHRVLVPELDANGDEVLDAGGNPVLVIARTGLNARGRYAVHFHRTGINPGDTPAAINDSAVVDSPGWGIVNHSSNVTVSNNVVFNALGAAYVTEAGDEIGSFDHNIAIHSRGSGDSIESRKQVQDFGHQGDGFWLQGGNVSLTNNVVAGQRHSGYVFFPVGLNQKGLGITTIPAADLANPSWAGTQTTVAVGDVPLRQFKGNVAFASGDAFESWFSLLDVKDNRHSFVEDFRAWGLSSGTGMFDPYTNNMTFDDVELTGNLNNPGGTAYGRNDVTRNLTFDHVNLQGWRIGIDAPVNGTNEVIGGTFNNLRNIDISTTNDLNRTVNIHDASATDPVNFLNNLTYKDKSGVHARTQWNLYLHTNFSPMNNDITTNFRPDIVRIGLVSINGAQVYYKEQAADFTPFPSADHPNDPKFGPKAAAFVPTELLDKTNTQLFAQYGLAIGAIVAPTDAVDGTPQHVNGLIGPTLATYLPDVRLVSGKYVNTASYTLSYKYFDSATGKYKTVTETSPTTLHSGWNLLTRQIAGATRTLLVYGDFTPPTFQFDPGVIRTVNKADIDNGATFVVSGNIVDDSFGKRHFEVAIQLNDPAHVSAIHKDAGGNDVITLTFTIKDFAGNTTTVSVDLQVSYTAILTKDVGRRNQPTIQASDTLKALLLGL